MSSIRPVLWWAGIVVGIVVLGYGLDGNNKWLSFLGAVVASFCIPFYIETLAERVFERKEREDSFWRKH